MMSLHNLTKTLCLTQNSKRPKLHADCDLQQNKAVTSCPLVINRNLTEIFEG